MGKWFACPHTFSPFPSFTHSPPTPHPIRKKKKKNTQKNNIYAIRALFAPQLTLTVISSPLSDFFSLSQWTPQQPVQQNHIRRECRSFSQPPKPSIVESLTPSQRSPPQREQKPSGEVSTRSSWAQVLPTLFTLEPMSMPSMPLVETNLDTTPSPPVRAFTPSSLHSMKGHCGIKFD